MSEKMSFPDEVRQQLSFASLAVLGLLIYASAITAFNIPSNIRIGWEGQAAIKMLDEMRRPFLAMKIAQNHVFTADALSADEEMHAAQSSARALLTQYLDLAQYNPAVEREVRLLSRTFETWVSAQSHLAHQWNRIRHIEPETGTVNKREVSPSLMEHINLMNEAESYFLITMNKLSDGEHPIHADIDTGRTAGLVLFALTVLLAVYLAGAMFLDERMRARAQKETYERELGLHHLAHYDTLTGLPNRTLFNDRLVAAMAAARRERARAAVLFIDLDGFKEVNDRYGHEVGDRVLIETAKRLSSCVREVDTVARLGGDEFVILMGNITDPADSVRVAKKVVSSFDRPFSSGKNAPRVGASVGIAHYPDDGKYNEELIKAADAAMYDVKKNHKGGSYQLASDLAPAMGPVPVTG